MRALRSISRQISANRSRIAIGLLLLIWIYFLGSFGQQAWRSKELSDEVAGQRQGIEQLERENADLRDQLQRLTSPAYEDYVRGVARRDLGLAMPDETIVLMRWQGERPPMKEPADPEPPAQDDPNWQRWIDLFSNATGEQQQ